jgi:CRP-like cAMP-binding protein
MIQADGVHQKKAVASQAAEQFLAAPFLADLDVEARRILFGYLDEQRAPAGAVLVAQGKPNDRLAFLIEGGVTVERTAPKHPKEILATLQAPAVFGTLSFFRPTATQSTSIRAAVDVRFLTLSRSAYERLRRQHPHVSEALALAALRVLAERFDMLDQRISEQWHQAQESHDHHQATEWSDFRARLFEESN